jgi:hypothetical protein
MCRLAIAVVCLAAAVGGPAAAQRRTRTAPFTADVWGTGGESRRVMGSPLLGRGQCSLRRGLRATTAELMCSGDRFSP